MASDWQELVFLATDQLFTETLGPAIRDDAKAFCPIFFGENSTAGETSRQIAESLGTPMPGGSLHDSIEDHLNGHDLIVAATGSGERTYAYWVETGHRIVVFGHDTGREKEATPFLRPALYQVRGLAA